MSASPRSLLSFCLLALLLVATNAFRTTTTLTHSARVPLSRRNLFGTSRPKPPSGGNQGQGGAFNHFGGLGGPGGLPGGAGGQAGLGGLMEGLKKAQEMMSKMAEMEERMKEVTLTHTDPSGQISVTFKGVGAPVSVVVTDELLSSPAGQDAAELSKRLTDAVIAAHAMATTAMKNDVEKMFADSGLPNDPAIMDKFNKALGQ